MQQFSIHEDVVVTHRHGTVEQPMRAVDDDRLDGLRVRQFTCDCGFAAAVLSRVDDEEPGRSWPATLRTSRPLV